jgi:hypothetical protein
MKVWLRSGLEILAVILVLPQVFIFLYFFRYLFIGSNGLSLLKTLVVSALTISWVSAPFLAVLSIAVKALITIKVRWTVTLLVCVVAGYVWLTAWNVLVFNEFSYGWSALPILLCSLGFSGYTAARMLYLESLEPLTRKVASGEAGEEPAKSAASDLSE